MLEVRLDERGRLTVPKTLRRRYGDRYRIVESRGGIRLIPVSDDPLAVLRSEFEDVEPSAAELREAARDTALEDTGR